LTDIRFYQLLETPLEAALPKLLEKATSQGMRACIATGTAERAQALDAALWIYAADSFLPHGRAPSSGADQPIWLAPNIENPNGADLLVTLDGQQPERFEDWKLVCDMFDGTDEAALEAARARWKTLKAAGHVLSYWRQTPAGAWEKAA
jgi:DNA polymerase III subunit chi